MKTGKIRIKELTNVPQVEYYKALAFAMESIMSRLITNTFYIDIARTSYPVQDELGLALFYHILPEKDALCRMTYLAQDFSYAIIEILIADNIPEELFSDCYLVPRIIIDNDNDGKVTGYEFLTFDLVLSR